MATLLRCLPVQGLHDNLIRPLLFICWTSVFGITHPCDSCSALHRPSFSLQSDRCVWPISFSFLPVATAFSDPT